jgi:hypothetical protein
MRMNSEITHCTARRGEPRAWKVVKDKHFKASELLHHPDQELSDEGMKLFVENFGSLCD